MKKAVLMISALIFFSTVGFSETLPWRPSCQPVAGPWIESHDGAAFQEFCYYNDTAFYVQSEMFINRFGQLFKGTNPDAYIQGVNYEQPTGPLKVGDINISFEFYYPFYNDGTQCPVDPANFNPATGFHNVPQYILAGDETANFSTGTSTFNDVFLNFTLDGGCGVWNNFNKKISAFNNDFGSSFSHNSRILGTIGFEVSNVYIRNLKAIGAAAPSEKRVW